MHIGKVGYLKLLKKYFLKQIFYIPFQPTRKQKRGVGAYREGESDKSQDQRHSPGEEVCKWKICCVLQNMFNGFSFIVGWAEYALEQGEDFFENNNLN